ncbi:MAG: hypothetical protein RMJ98_01440 [Myxococcales bacterium]|nr:hypothetical protein [Polyangiaceae bacterium]MDW8247951.1 hypothetical protein [Myxococcales bacterium]
MNPVDQALQGFTNEDYTVRLCSAIFGTLPFAPPMPSYRTLDGAIQTLFPQATPHQKARATELASSEGIRSVLWVANAIDTGDAGIAVYSGLKSAFSFFFGSGSRMDALETDPQQGTDAGLKLLGLAYMIHKAFPGALQDKVQLFQITPAGQALAIYYGAVEIALPFSDNLVQSGGDFLQRLMSRYGNDASSKLGGALGGAAVQEAQGMLSALMGPIQGVLNQVAPHAQTIANTAKQYIPGFMNAADKVAGAVATGADALPVYRYLGTRLAAESCVLLASRGL